MASPTTAVLLRSVAHRVGAVSLVGSPAGEHVEVMTDSLYNRPDLYDLVSPDDPQMIGYYVAAAGGPGRKVLDLACGTGRITLPLAASGAKVVGGDVSPDMLARAKSRAAEQRLAVRFAELDMRDFDLGERFDAIVVAANSLLHLHSRDDFDGFFASARRHLSLDGRLLFDVFVPSAHLLSLPTATRQPLAQLGEITVDETIDYDAISQIAQVDWYWSRPGAPDFWHVPLRLRQIFPQELPLLVAAGGLRMVERHGDFDLTPFAAGCRRQVATCALP